MVTLRYCFFERILVICLWLVAANAGTAQHVWTGQVNNDWNQPQNWNPQIVPTVADDVIIPDSITGFIRIDGANASCRSLTYTGTGLKIQLLNGWRLIAAGNLVLDGHTVLEGNGRLEFTGPGPIAIHTGDSVRFIIAGMDVKTSGTVSLAHDLDMRFSDLAIYSGTFKSDGYTAWFSEVYLMPGNQPRLLDVSLSQFYAGRMFLYTGTGGGIYAAHSDVYISLSLFIYGTAAFHHLHTRPGVLIMADEDFAAVHIDHLLAEGDVKVKGSTNRINQSYTISRFTINTAPSIILLTATPYVNQYRIDTLDIPPSCQGQILVYDETETQGSRINLFTPSGLQLDGVAMANCRSVSGNITVINGTSLGNNSGIQFTGTAASTLYWIGGTGEWSDGNHWSYTSGGTPSGCVPRLHDQAVLDINSGFTTGDTVHIHHHVFVHDFYTSPLIPSPPVVATTLFNGQTLNFAGSIDLSGVQRFEADAVSQFWGNAQHSLRMAGKHFLSNLIFYTPGEWHLMDSLVICDGTRGIVQLNGTLHTHDQTMRISHLVSNSIKQPYTARGLVLGASVIHIGHPSQATGYATINSAQMNLDAGTSVLVFDFLGNDQPYLHILGPTHLHFYAIRFRNQLNYPVIVFNQKSDFRSIYFEGNGRLLHTTPLLQPEHSAADTLRLSGGFRYEMESGCYFGIHKKLVTLTQNCQQLALLTSTSLQNRALIYHATTAITADHIMAVNMDASGNPATIFITQGYDGGNNSNFSFSQNAIPRVFYWNGEDNAPQWSHARNWNIGQPPLPGPNNDPPLVTNPDGCIPGFIDSVVFHPHSFPLKDTVDIDQLCNYSGMQWMPGSGAGRFWTGPEFYGHDNYGALQLDAGLTITYNGTMTFRSASSRGIQTGGVRLPGNCVFYSLGSYHLLDSITCGGNHFSLVAGSFYAHGHNLNLYRFNIQHLTAPAAPVNRVNLQGSTIRVKTNWANDLYNDRSLLEADSTTTLFAGSSMLFVRSTLITPPAWGRVYFCSSAPGTVHTAQSVTGAVFHKIEFNADGNLLGNNRIDSLVLAEGNMYRLQDGAIQDIIHALISRGSPCYRTTITSSTPGVRAFIRHPGCNILVEHARLRDIEGLTSGCSNVNYRVNIGGEDLGNNANWVFVPGNPIEGLGPDTLAGCHSFPFLQSSSGFGAYQHITWSNGLDTAQLSVCQPDTITAWVTYSPKCHVQDSRIISLHNTLTIEDSLVHEPCYGDSLGSIVVATSGGNGQYSYQWTSGNLLLPADSLLLHLPAGMYYLHTAQQGYENFCFADTQFIITEPQPLHTELISTPVTCHDAANGTLIASTSGGVSPYQIVWSHTTQLHSDTAVALLPGIYEVTITDAHGCLASVSDTLLNPPPIAYTLAVHPEDCGLGNGSAEIMISGGVGNFTIQWQGDTTLTGPAIFQTGESTWVVTATDSLGCSISDTAAIPVINVPQVNVVSQPPTCYGMADGELHINPSGGAAPYTCMIRQVSSGWNTGFVAQHHFSQLSGGLYEISVKDTHNCLVKTSRLLQEPDLLQVNAQSVQNPTCHGELNGIANALVNGGTAPYQLEWLHNGSVAPWQTQLAAGTYTVVATDQHHCTASGTVVLSDPEPLVVSVVQTVPVSCNYSVDGLLQASAQGGSGHYAYTWTPGDSTNATLYCGKGAYSVRVMDENGCRDSAGITVTAPPPLLLSIEDLTTGKCDAPDGAITMQVSGGTPTYTYRWDGAPGNDRVQVGLYPGVYSITVKDALGCIAETTIQLGCSDSIFIPRLITPNGDGYNDTWEISDLMRLYPQNRVNILNRWGNVVYSESPYTNTFDGIPNTGNTLGDGRLPAGTYFYTIDLGKGYGVRTGFLELQY